MVDVKALLTRLTLALKRPNSVLASYYQTAANTTTSSKNLITRQFTSNTGRVMIIATAIIQTSANTSGLRIMQESKSKGVALTNATSPTPITVYALFDVDIGTAYTYYLQMYSQNTSTTATARAYNTGTMLIVDIPTY